MRRIGQHLRSNIVGYIALFFAISTGGAVALDGTNSVFSDDIAPGEVKPADIEANAVNGSKIADNQVSTLDVRNDSLSGGGLGANDLRPDSVGGSEVQDGSLTPADSTNIVQRARGTTSVGTGDGGFESVSYPLTNDTWTQQADEVDSLVPEVTIEAPQTCSQPVNGSNDVRIGIRQDGTTLLGQSFGIHSQVLPLGETRTFGPNWFLLNGGYTFEPGAPAQRTLTARISDNCGAAGEEFIVHSVKVDVIGFR